MAIHIGRRKFIATLGTVVAWPLAARAQHAERMRRVGVLATLEEQARYAAVLQGLQQSGWTDGGNVRIDYRFGAGDPERNRRYAAELVALAPDVILATSSNATAALQQVTRVVPIVFVNVADPVGAGFVASLAQPGGNITGFLLYDLPPKKWTGLSCL